MAKGKSSSQSNKDHYKSYNYDLNRTKRLQKLAKEQPSNEQIQAALKNIHYRRKVPKLRAWTPKKRELAQMERITRSQYVEPKTKKLGYFEELKNEYQ
jgi:hypothetical protein